MNILVSNDDGINSRGLRVLVKALSEIPDNRVYVWAPDGQRSACGHGITTTGPIFLNEKDVKGAEEAWALSGTPADCVKSGIKKLKREKNIQIDAVFSGINHGGNIGSDVLYSGTVSAAAEGVLCGVLAVAISVGTHTPTDGMLENCGTIIREICEKALPGIDSRTILNVNFPPIAPSEIKGLRITRLGPREYAENFDMLTGPRGQKYYWYTGELVVYENLPDDYDVMAQQNGYISVTPMQLDLTNYELRDKIRGLSLKF